MAVYKCLCSLLAIICVINHWLDVYQLWCRHGDIPMLWLNLCYCLCPIMSLYGALLMESMNPYEMKQLWSNIKNLIQQKLVYEGTQVVRPEVLCKY